MCTIERVEMLISINIVGRVEVTLIKKLERGSVGSKRWSYNSD